MFEQQEASLGHQHKAWDPCNQKIKAEFSPRYNSIGLPYETRARFGRVIPNKPRVMEPINLCKAKAISRWKGEPITLPISPVGNVRGGAKTARHIQTLTARSPVGLEGTHSVDNKVFRFPATSHASSRYGGSRGLN